MIENALCLAKDLDVDLKRLQQAWERFAHNRKNHSAEIVIGDIKAFLSVNECNFLLYLGMDYMSDKIKQCMEEENSA